MAQASYGDEVPARSDPDVDHRAGALPEEVEGPAALLGPLAGRRGTTRSRASPRRARSSAPPRWPADPALGGRGHRPSGRSPRSTVRPHEVWLSRATSGVFGSRARPGRPPSARSLRPRRLGSPARSSRTWLTGSVGGAATCGLPRRPPGVETTRARLAAREVATQNATGRASDRPPRHLEEPAWLRVCRPADG